MTYLPPIDSRIQQAINVIYSTYGDTVSVQAKKKNLIKFGARSTVGTNWETLMTTVGSELEETFVSGNDIDTVVSSNASDNGKTLTLEYHTLSGGNAIFGTQTVTLDASDATTPVSLSTAGEDVFRASRLYNTSSSALLGNIYVYEDNTGRDDNKTHLVIPAGEQQTQKAATTISSSDYWIITEISGSVTEKTGAWAEMRLEIKPISGSYWRPISQNFAITDNSGTVDLFEEPFLIVPKNYDVRLAVRTNAGSVDVAGGFNGYLASVI